MFTKKTPKQEWIIYDDNPIMKQKIIDVEFPLSKEDIDAINKMISYVDSGYENTAIKYKIQPSIGIAAIQIGYPKKIIYIHLDQDGIEHKYLLANPKIIQKSLSNAYLEYGEGCLSVKEKIDGFVIRKENVKVSGFDLFENKEIIIDANGLLSMCFQHEIDHNNNKFYYNSINENDPFFTQKDWKKI